MLLLQHSCAQKLVREFRPAVCVCKRVCVVLVVVLAHCTYTKHAFARRSRASFKHSTSSTPCFRKMSGGGFVLHAASSTSTILQSCARAQDGNLLYMKSRVRRSQNMLTLRSCVYECVRVCGVVGCARLCESRGPHGLLNIQGKYQAIIICSTTLLCGCMLTV